MLNAEDNALLTRVGPNTPMGEYLRRYWVPSAALGGGPRSGLSPRSACASWARA